MSNLGPYQTMTTIAKKIGGPINLLGVVAAGGYSVFRIVEIGVKKGVDKLDEIKKSKAIKASVLYTVSKEGTSNEGLHFNVGDTFHVLQQVGDAVLVEKVGDTNNPYFVAYDFLMSISNFK